MIGGAAGAPPALIGWAAVTGEIGGGGLLLALVIFLWTPAHFYNLALAYKDDYERARRLPDDARRSRGDDDAPAHRLVPRCDARRGGRARGGRRAARRALRRRRRRRRRRAVPLDGRPAPLRADRGRGVPGVHASNAYLASCCSPSCSTRSSSERGRRVGGSAAERGIGASASRQTPLVAEATTESWRGLAVRFKFVRHEPAVV